MAWEVTTDDVELVCRQHDVVFTDEIFELIDADEVEKAVLYYVDFDNQVSAALCEIENQLMEAGIIKGEKIHNSPEEDPDFKDEWDFGDEDE
jgi:hypothetical protein